MTSDTVNRLINFSLARSVLGIGLIAASIISFPLARASNSSVEPGFPTDFVSLYEQSYGDFKDTGGKGEGQTIGGFGGLKDKTREENRDELEHIPVILLHGNGVHALQAEETRGFIDVPTLGAWPLRDFLVNELGYSDAEIWAISYLGSSPPPSEAELGPMVQENLPDVRRFIDTVIEYLGVDKVDIIAHSLGNNMAKGYMNGFHSDNSWDNSDHRLSRIGTYVSLAAGHYGVTGLFLSPSDTDPGSVFETGAHKFNGITDDTPYGALRGNQRSDNDTWVEQTSLDEEVADGSHDPINYVAIRSKQDFVDSKVNDSSRLEGAHLNHEFDFTKHGEIDPLNLVEHSKVVTDESVFNKYAGYLNGGTDDDNEDDKVWTATNGEHESAGRAHTTFFVFYYSNGSDDYLGFSTQTTTLKETSPGYYSVVD